MTRSALVMIVALVYASYGLAFGQTLTDQSTPIPSQSLVNPTLPAAVPPTEKLDSFEENSVELRWVQGGWQLWAGTTILKDFGKKEQDGRTVLGLIRELHLNARGKLGAPHAVAEYWLSQGKPPQAAPQGARTLGFDPKSLKVEQVNGQWLLRDRRRALISFGNNEGEARRALAVFTYHHFNRVGFVGEPTPTFMYFLATMDGAQYGIGDLADQEQEREKSIHAAHGSDKSPDFKQNKIDPRQNSQLLPPGRQLIQVTAVPGQANLPDRLPFNWQKAQVRSVGENWELASQDLTIASFNLDEGAARQALELLRHYHFTELYLVGGDEPCFRFLLVNGRMPRDLRFGVANIAFHSERVQVIHSGGNYVLDQDGVCLVNLGPREEAARDLCAFIQQNNPDHLCWLGPDPQHGMAFFVRTSLAPFNSRNDAPRKP